MSTRLHLASIIALVTGTLATPGIAQTEHNMHGSPAATSAPKAAATAMGEGNVKKIDTAKGTVTLTHGALPNGMPPMTMAYKVKDAAWLDTLKVGQKILFATDPADGMTVSHFEPAK
ncbi:MAG: copper-binding protein [Rhodoferax sp.]|uniref:copper-binding protein n=1 Tax=Rhodoferax sp. TaxID=50421 RepID=UPI0013FEB762|nr:copper-binding protein [Rhodoferax sp.]NDP38062.1 copper-binding protein [Rhodoferax sp.]